MKCPHCGSTDVREVPGSGLHDTAPIWMCESCGELFDDPL